jgi:hypothetical protein
MKELLIRIKALFQGAGTKQAEDAIRKVDAAADKASASTGKLGNSMSGASTKSAGFAGVMAGATAALTTFALDAAMKAVTAIANLGKAFAQGILQIADFAGKMSDLSARTGQPISQLVVLEQAFKNAGIGAEQVGPAINKMQNAIVNAGNSTSPAAEAFRQLGIDVNAFRKQDSVGQFNDIAKAVGSIKDPAQQTALMIDLFGRSGGQMLAVFKDTQAFQTAATQIGSLGKNLETAAPALDAFSDAYASIDVKKQQFFAGAAAQFASELEKAGIALNNLDLGPLGEQFGFVIRGAIEIGRTINQWIGYIKQFTDLLGLTGPLLDAIKNAMLQMLGPMGQIVAFMRSTGEEAVKNEQHQKRVDAAIQMQANSAQIARDFIAEARAESGSLAAEVGQTGAAAVDSAAGNAATRIDESGNAAREGIATTTQEGANKIQLTAEQVNQAAQQLAQAFQEGMGANLAPALQALVSAVQANFTNLTASITQGTQSIAQSNQSFSQNITSSFQAIAQQTANNDRALSASISALSNNLASAVNGLQRQINALAARR